MNQQHPGEPITIRTAKVAEVGAMAMDRSRNDIVNQAIEQYLKANRWQIEKSKQGIRSRACGPH